MHEGAFTSSQVARLDCEPENDVFRCLLSVAFDASIVLFWECFSWCWQVLREERCIPVMEGEENDDSKRPLSTGPQTSRNISPHFGWLNSSPLTTWICSA
jgi:hypothetical protein